MFNSEIHIIVSLKCIVLLVMAQEALSSTEMGTGMRNKHLLVAGESFAPFLTWECPESQLVRSFLRPDKIYTTNAKHTA